MIEKENNFWLEKADYHCIPTTGATNSDGSAVMESGVAKEAARRYAGIEIDLGRLLTARGNHVHLIRQGVVSFPIQQFLWSGPNLQIIARSVRELTELIGDGKAVLPRPGCGEGELPWEDVVKVLASLPDNVVVVKQV